MLITFDSTIININANNQNENRALETLLNCFHKMQHVLFFNMRDMDLIKDRILPTLSLGGRVTWQTIYNRLPEYKQLLSIVERKIVVYIEDEKNKGVHKKNKDWHIPLHLFSSISIIESAIIGENPSDAELSIKFAEQYASKNKINSFILKARTLCGGGSVTPKSLANYLRSEHSPCICITDSDKFHPTFKQSDTSKRCAKAITVAKTCVAEHYLLEEREIENLIPHDLLIKIPRAKEFISKINESVITDEKHWRYIDIKHGVSLSWIDRQDEKTKIYWKKAHAALRRSKSQCFICKNKNVEKEFSCACETIPGLGENILTNTISYMTDNPSRINLRLLDSDLRWEGIAKVVFDFTVAPKGEMAR